MAAASRSGGRAVRSVEILTTNITIEMKLFDLFKKKPLLTFTREFPVIGTMTCKAISEEKCKSWKKRMDFCCWKNTTFMFGDDENDPEKLSIMTNQVQKALANSHKIEAQIKNDFRYQYLLGTGKDCMIPDNPDDVDVTARATDDSGEMSPLIEVGYLSQGMYVWLVIQDGDMTAFTAEEE